MNHGPGTTEGDVNDALRYAALIAAVRDTVAGWERGRRTGETTPWTEAEATLEILADRYGREVWLTNQGVCVAGDTYVDVIEVADGVIIDDTSGIDGVDDADSTHDYDETLDEMLEELDDDDHAERWKA